MGRKIYTISYLLDKQPKAIRKDKNYQLMISYLQKASPLISIRFNKRCYSLLNNAVIKPEHLENFYRTYGLPKHPFFPLFFMIKRQYLINRENKKIERQEYIDEKMKNLPLHIEGFFNLLANLEIKYNRAGQNPVYKQTIMAKTKKQVDRYSSFGHPDWLIFMDDYFASLTGQYERIPADTIDRLSACFILKCIPDSINSLPGHSQIKTQYRSFSKEFHPDTGGDPRLFIRVKWARDYLLDNK
ncbi:MAG: hypothetical protein JEY91_15615 [Spirochaetaceae bacterium]|nr:hypothetical protein [Spirochaetaceae bacterium]